MAIDYTTPIGQVRLLIADVNDVEADRLFTDTQITGFLAIAGVPADETAPASWSVRRAAASALDAIATSEVLISKVIRTQDLSTDGAKVAAELRAQAKAQRDQAKAEEEDGDDGSYMGIVEFSPYPAGRPELTERPFGWWY